MSKEGAPVIAYLFLAFSLFAFSSIEVLSKPLMGKIDPFFMTAFRFLIGGAVLALFVREKLPSRDIVGMTFVGLLNSMVSMTSLQLAVKYSNASTAATLVASNPLFVSFFAILLLREKHRATKYFGIALGFCGILVFSLGKLRGDSWLGIFFGVTAAATFGLYTVLMRRYTKRFRPLTVTAYSSLFSGIIYVATLLVLGSFRSPNLSFGEWGLLLYFGVVVTGIAYVTYFKAMEYVGATQSSRIFFLKPIVATLMALVFLGEPIGATKLIGMAIVLVSLTL